MMIRLLAFLFAATLLHAQSIRYEVPQKTWDKNLGTHRVVVKVDAPAEAVRANLEWRRRDPQPEKHGVVVTDSAGKRVENALATLVTNDAGEVVFQAAAAGEYAVYFLPGAPGSGSFPSAKYLGPQDTGSADWKGKLGDVKKLPEAKAIRWEARTEHDRFNEMEIIATKAEKDAWLAKNPGDVHVFLESRERPVRMFDQVPEIWLKREKPPEFVARPGEVFVFQVGVWVARNDYEVFRGSRRDLKSATGKVISYEAISFPSDKVAKLASGNVYPIWAILSVPTDAVVGDYAGEIGVFARSVQGAGPEMVVPVKIKVAGDALADHGDSKPENLTKLRWLDSNIAKDGNVPKPLTSLEVVGKTIHCLGRSLVIGDDGLPVRIATSFDASVTKIGEQTREILTQPIRLLITKPDGSVETLKHRILTDPATQGDGSIEWTSLWEGPELALAVVGRMEPDGHVQFKCEVGSLLRDENLERSITLEITRTADTCKYSMGLGYYGGAAQLPVDWKWDVRKHQDAHWMGDVNAGLRVRLTAENYVRPMINIHYPRQPLNDPPSWSGGGKGGIKIERKDAQTVLFTAYSGPRTLEPGKPLHFNFDLSITPFKPLNTAAQWKDRYFHVGGIQDPAKVKATGANIINIHQGNALNPYINYPFLTADKLREYADKVHALGMRVKYYYTIRELSNWTPEIFAMRSFGSELLAPGKGGGHGWLEEHLGGNYWGAWYEPGTNDASVLTATKSRFDNLYLEGLRWLIENAGCDGIYLDDISFDRTVMKRARKILDQYATRGGLIDLHSWNEMNGMAGFASNALIFMDSLPYVDRMWFGEGHHYNVSAEQMLVGISGIPYGLMGEMLEGGGNPWLGLPFGMTGRLGWGGSPQPVWKLWDDFGVADSQFIGWWDSANPVKTESPDCRATIWKKNGKTLIAVGNYSGKGVRTKLVIDWKALGLDPATCALYAPPMDNFQPELLFKPDAAIGIAAWRGFAFILDATPRNVAKPVSALTLDKTKIVFEDTFLPAPRDGWKNVASKRIESIKPDKEGLVFLAPANVHAWTERPLPDGTKTVAAQIRQDAGDEGNSWGPGIALVWPDGKFLKANRRKDGRFGISANGGEKLTGLCDIESPVTVAFVLEKEHIRIVATGPGTFDQDIELARIPRKDYPGQPATIRLGKIPNNGKPEDHAEAGQMGWSRVDWVRVYGE
ncbi:MAG: hypothetical protein RL088_1409 [Verrucomicrobiota bacterium]|jgi:hypothetical protein